MCDAPLFLVFGGVIRCFIDSIKMYAPSFVLIFSEGEMCLENPCTCMPADYEKAMLALL